MFQLFELNDHKSPKDFYLVYTIEKIDNNEFRDIEWDISKLNGYKSGHQSARPFAVSLADLMAVVCKHKEI